MFKTIWNRKEEIHKAEGMIISTYLDKLILLPQFIFAEKLFKAFVWKWNINVIFTKNVVGALLFNCFEMDLIQMLQAKAF